MISHCQWMCDAQEGGLDSFTFVGCVLCSGVHPNLTISKDCACLIKIDNNLRAGETWIVAIGDPEHTWSSDTFVTACKHAQETNYERLYFECYCLWTWDGVSGKKTCPQQPVCWRDLTCVILLVKMCVRWVKKGSVLSQWSWDGVTACPGVTVAAGLHLLGSSRWDELVAKAASPGGQSCKCHWRHLRFRPK